MSQTLKPKSSYRVAVASGVFCIVLSLLLLLNFRDLKEEVYSFEILVPKGSFMSPWQIITGSFLHLGG